jgi:hypothetical protein
VWLKAGPGNQALMVQAAPARFFRPPYVGPSGWVGAWLDQGVDWAELEGLARDAYRLVAPKRLTMALEQAERRPPRPRQTRQGSPGRGGR